MKAVAIGIMLALVPPFVFAQVAVTAECPDAECHVAPFFRGSGGFVGQFNREAMADGAALTEVGLVVTCGNVTTTASIAPAADGTVAHLFNDMNSLACYQEGGEIQIHGLMDGGWYWIHEETNSAVSNLLPKNVLDNMQTPPFDVSGGVISMTRRDNATLVKDTASGRIGILPHILPAVEPVKCGGATRSGCVLTGDYTVEIEFPSDALVSGTTIQRGSENFALRLTIGDEGNVTVDPERPVTGVFNLSGPGDSAVPRVYGNLRWTLINGDEVMYVQEPTHEVRSIVPRATDGSGALLDLDASDPCRSGNQQRDAPITVVVTITSSTNTIPGFGPAGGPTASYSISCPPTPAASGGLEGRPGRTVSGSDSDLETSG